MPTYARISRQLFEDYARKIGADYRFDKDPDFIRGKFARYFAALRPVHDEAFHVYDRVLYVDMDIIPLASVSRNIFDEPVGHLAMVEETGQPAARDGKTGNINLRNDRRWARMIRLRWGIRVPVDELNRPRVFNTGLVLYSREGLKFVRDNFPKIRSYQLASSLARLPDFYRIDQNYLGAFIALRGCDFTLLPVEWNSQVLSFSDKTGAAILVDSRTANSRFIHMQHSARAGMTAEQVLAVSRSEYDFRP